MDIIEIDEKIISLVYKKREKNVRKKNFGNSLIIGGSKLYPTTPILVALSAYRSGTDWVTIVSPEYSSTIISSYNPNLMVYPLKGEYLNKENIEDLIKLSEKRDAIEIGGGLTRSDDVLNTINEYLEKIKNFVIIDDDALYAIAKRKDLLNKNIILTPNSYEFYILFGEKISYDINERIEKVKKYAKEYNTTILLKGPVDVISDGERVGIVKKGYYSRYMTKEGFGNTLAGILVSTLIRTKDSFIASCSAAYINGKAGEFAAKKYLEGVLPTDLIEEIPNVLKKYLKEF
ncbi:MAG: NAD(P)H-hydrate dehydratase [Nanopusillaceae archaeon]|jgi:NAD(P)H-hydrate epimerase